MCTMRAMEVKTLICISNEHHANSISVVCNLQNIHHPYDLIILVKYKVTSNVTSVHCNAQHQI